MSQEKWFALCDKLGESEARKLVSQRLREAADIIDSGQDPDIFGADVPENGICKDTFINTVSVTLSFPWPG